MPRSMEYQMAQNAFQPMGCQYGLMQQQFARRHPDHPIVQELAQMNRLRQQSQAQQQDQQCSQERDDEIRNLTKKMEALSQQLVEKNTEEVESNAQMKEELKERFIAELERRQELSGTFEDCDGVIIPCEKYVEDDPVTLYFAKDKGVDLKNKNWDAENDAICMRKGIRGWGTDEEKIIRITATRSNAQRQQIYNMYKTLFGRDLAEDLRGDLSGNFKDAIMALYKRPAYFDAYSIKKAIYGLGTDEQTLIEILMTRTNAQLKEMLEEYNAITYEKQKTPSYSLEKDIKGDTSGDFKRLLISASTANRDVITHEKLCSSVEDVEMNGKWTGMFKVNYETLCNMGKCKRQAQELYDAGEEKWGTDEETFNRIFSVRDMYSLREIYKEYVKISQRDIVNSVDRETSGNFRTGLRAIAQSVKCRPLYFAERLKDAMKGLGTDDTTLIRIVASRSEIDMVQIKACFLELTKQTLWNYIDKDTSGDYKKLLLAIVGKN